MKNVELSPEIVTDIEDIDEQHRSLFALGERFQSLGRAPSDLSRVIEFLRAYANYHFSSEERVMQVSEFPREIPHCAEHEAIRGEIEALAAELRLHDGVALPQRVAALLGRLLQHIRRMDLDLARHLKRPAIAHGLDRRPGFAALRGKGATRAPLDFESLARELAAGI